MSIETIAVTGGNGQIGRSIVAHLNDCGYHTINIARGKQREEKSDQYIRTDLLDPGNVYGSLKPALTRSFTWEPFRVRGTIPAIQSIRAT